METKFKQPVSMRVTKEQYEKDLKPSLLMLGYKEDDVTDWTKRQVWATNYSGIEYLMTNLEEEDKDHNNRHFIPEYNPQLFIAIAAMTKGETPIAGEWLKKDRKYGINTSPYLRLKGDGGLYERATLQELIEIYSNKKQEEIMETKELIENLKPLIAPENMEKFNKLMGIKKPMFKAEDFITGDKVILRNGKTYLAIRDCNAGFYGAQVFVLVRCEVDGGFMNSDEYNEKLLHNEGDKYYDIMKIYRCEEGRIMGNSFSPSIRNYKLIWERESNGNKI